MSEKLPVRGFVLAGGRSSRMGVDKALLELNGRPLVEIAVEKLRSFCAEVSIVGNREDLAGFAPVVGETRVECGPAAGFEAGLNACQHSWAMFIPVDVPLIPAELLHRWAEATVAGVRHFEETSGPLMGCSLYTECGDEPAFAMLRPEVAPHFSRDLDKGERRLSVTLGEIRAHYGHAQYLRVNAAWYAPPSAQGKMHQWFANLNTPEDLEQARAY